MIDFKLDMATPTSSHMVGRCFVATETGTYFEGTGFLKAGEMTLRYMKGEHKAGIFFLFHFFPGHVVHAYKLPSNFGSFAVLFYFIIY